MLCGCYYSTVLFPFFFILYKYEYQLSGDIAWNNKMASTSLKQESFADFFGLRNTIFRISIQMVIRLKWNSVVLMKYYWKNDSKLIKRSVVLMLSLLSALIRIRSSDTTKTSLVLARCFYRAISIGWVNQVHQYVSDC